MSVVDHARAAADTAGGIGEAEVLEGGKIRRNTLYLRLYAGFKGGRRRAVQPVGLNGDIPVRIGDRETFLRHVYPHLQPVRFHGFDL